MKIKTHLFYAYNLLLGLTSCIILAALLFYITGCSNGGGSESNSATEITNCVESPGLSNEEIQEIVETAESDAVDVPVEDNTDKNQEGNIIVVGCGGTFVDTNTEITTNTENNETNNELTRILNGLRNGDITYIELK